MYDKLRNWYETFQADAYTLSVVGALVDIAESADLVLDGHDPDEDGITQEARDCLVALADLETALDDADAAQEAAGCLT